MTNQELVARWHRERPEWTAKLSARDWDFMEEVATQLDGARAPDPKSCTVPPEGWYCTRQAGHEGPCAAHKW